MIRLILEAVKEWVEEILVTFKAMYLGYVTPQMYGAKGDGVTDDTEAIQSAINHGGTIYFPQGTYIVTPKIVVRKSVTLTGDKGRSILKINENFATPNVHMFEFGTAGINGISGICVNNLILRGSETYGSDQYGASLLMFWGVSNITIDNCIFQNNKYSVVQLSYNTVNGIKTGCHNINVTDCRFEACDCGVVSGNAPTSDVFIKGCYFSGKSSLNDFTNYYSEQIGTYAKGDLETPNIRWTIEDCIFEYKHTAAICFGVNGDVANGKIINKDISIRNCTFRGTLNAISLSACENVNVDGIYVDGTENAFPQTTQLFHVLTINKYSNRCTIRNVVSESKELKSQFLFDNSSNVLIENVTTYTDDKEETNGLPYIIIQNVTTSIFRNFDIVPNGDNKRAVVHVSKNSANNVIDIHGNKKNGAEVVYYVVDLGTVRDNIFRIDTDNNVSRSIPNIDPDTGDLNKWVKYGNGIVSTNYIKQINQYTLPKRYEISFNSAEQLNTAQNVDKFFALNDQAEIILDFIATNFSNGKQFIFASTGNIIPINTPFTFSNDYKVVCHFKQINNKWVETQRLLEYYAGATVDVTDTDPDIDFSESGDLVIKGTDGTMRKIIFNQDGTCSWETPS